MPRSHGHDMPCSRSKARRLGAFWRDDSGTVTIFALMMFILMLAAGGIAIDVMRYETQRTQLQYTLDRAVLAAASLSQQEDPEAVVIDYFATSGLENYRLDVDVEEGLNFRRVSASVEMDLQAYFMNMFGVEALTSPARGSAEERVMDIEISMVLDISGSMGWNNKIRNMRDAANEFIDTVLDLNEGATERVSVSIVPYHSQVNAGTTLASVFTLSDEHQQSNCTRFDPSDYNSTGIDPDDSDRADRAFRLPLSQQLHHFPHTALHDLRLRCHPAVVERCRGSARPDRQPERQWQHRHRPRHAVGRRPAGPDGATGPFGSDRRGRGERGFRGSPQFLRGGRGSQDRHPDDRWREYQSVRRHPGLQARPLDRLP